MLEGFGFGAALLAMFMRVGGGIFTKAADVGADLVGKVEQNIPEDDPRNAATIADNVGDNVGDCAGMAADLFESYAVTLVAALILGSQAFGDKGLVFPLLIPAIGALTAVVGVYLCRPRPGENGLTTINRGFYISAAIAAVACVDPRVRLPAERASATSSTSPAATWPAPRATRGSSPRSRSSSASCWPRHPGADRLLHRHRVPPGQGRRQDVADRRGHGHPVRPRRSASSRRSTPTLVIGAAVFGAFLLGGATLTVSLFAVALAGCGLLTTVGVIVAMDTFGPVSDNAQGIAEMSGDVSPRGRADPHRARRGRQHHQGDHQGHRDRDGRAGRDRAVRVLRDRRSLEALRDANAVAPTSSHLLDFIVFNPSVLVGVLLGAAVVFLFSGLAINAVGRAAGAVVFEVRRQFREIPGIMEGTGRPEYGKVVDIVTKDSLRELVTPGLLAVLAPVAVGFGLGVGPLAGFLAGAIGAGTLMAVFLANSGGAWDNAKKLVEDGHHGGKGSLAHEATIIGDTVGDPFKDTAGPAINPLIKVMNLVSLLIAGAVVSMGVGEDENDALRIVIALVAARSSSSRSTSPSSARSPSVTTTPTGRSRPPHRTRRPRRDDGSEPGATQQFEPTQQQ